MSLNHRSLDGPWVHRRTKGVYHVLAVSNTSARPGALDRPVTVHYQGHDGEIWSLEIFSFLVKFDRIELADDGTFLSLLTANIQEARRELNLPKGPGTPEFRKRWLEITVDNMEKARIKRKADEPKLTDTWLELIEKGAANQPDFSVKTEPPGDE